MATRRYSINREDYIEDVTEAVGAAVATKSIEVTVDLAASYSRVDVLDALDRVKAWILKGSWPPA